jgi:hypothetical protein
MNYFPFYSLIKYITYVATFTLSRIFSALGARRRRMGGGPEEVCVRPRAHTSTSLWWALVTP